MSHLDRLARILWVIQIQDFASRLKRSTHHKPQFLNHYNLAKSWQEMSFS